MMQSFIGQRGHCDIKNFQGIRYTVDHGSKLTVPFECDVSIAIKDILKEYVTVMHGHRHYLRIRGNTRVCMGIY